MTGFAEDRISRVTTFSTGRAPFPAGCLSGNTILTLMTSGVAVFVGVSVFVGVGVLLGVKVGVFVGVREDVTVGVADGV